MLPVIETTIITKGILALPPKRVLDKVLKVVWEKVGLYWHKELFPKHFDQRAMQEYGYRRRKSIKWKRKDGSKVTYQQWKLKKTGEDAPLVFSGRLEREARREARISSTSKGCAVKLRCPPYVFFHGMAAELTKVSRKDRKLMIAKAREYLVEELKKLQKSGPTKRERY